MKKSLVSFFTVCLLLCTSFSVPVIAASFEEIPTETAYIEISPRLSNYFTGTTGVMNAIGGESRRFNISSGSIPTGAKITSVTISARGGGTIHVVHPSGVQKSKPATGTQTFTEFNGLYAGGTWQVYLSSSGINTVSGARLRVNYTY